MAADNIQGCFAASALHAQPSAPMPKHSHFTRHPVLAQHATCQQLGQLPQRVAHSKGTWHSRGRCQCHPVEEGPRGPPLPLALQRQATQPQSPPPPPPMAPTTDIICMSSVYPQSKCMCCQKRARQRALARAKSVVRVMTKHGQQVTGALAVCMVTAHGQCSQVRCCNFGNTTIQAFT